MHAQLIKSNKQASYLLRDGISPEESLTRFTSHHTEIEAYKKTQSD